MKKIVITMLAAVLISFAATAQEDPKAADIEKENRQSKKEKPGKKETQEIIIRKNGKKDLKLNVEIDGDNVTINGKPMSEFKDDDVTISKKKMIITDGDGMSWSFNGDAQNWEK